MFVVFFWEYVAESGDKNVFWKRYYTYGGLPYLVALDDNAKNPSIRNSFVLAES